ncbi:MAG: L-threonylcarbamoyladenylate synthase [Prolixibacteraceae bacterium]
MEEYYDDVAKALEVLRKGGIILYPTDTIWGIGCDATNAEAVKRIYDLKQREDSKSMLVLMENPNLMLGYIEEMPEVGWDLIEFAEKPTTIIYDGAKNLAASLIAEDGSIGIRITKEPFTQKLIQKFRKPIVSTSANISGQASPQNFSEISKEIKSKVDYIVTYRQGEKRNPAPSSIIKLGATGLIKIVRQ